MMLKNTFACIKGRTKGLYKGFFVLLLLWLAALVPLAALAAKAKALSLLCPVLMLFFVLPARVSSADALMRFARGGAFISPALISYAQYPKKLAYVIKQIIKIALFVIPLAALAGYVVYLLKGGVDFITLIILIKNLGGTIPKGLFVCLLIAVAAFIPILIGMGLYCADRFYQSGYVKTPPPVSRRTALKSGLLSFCLLLPAIALVIAAIITAGIRFVESFGQDRSGLRPALFMLAAAVLYYLPTAPIRKLITPVMLMNREGKPRA